MHGVDERERGREKSNVRRRWSRLLGSMEERPTRTEVLSANRREPSTCVGTPKPLAFSSHSDSAIWCVVHTSFVPYCILALRCSCYSPVSAAYAHTSRRDALALSARGHATSTGCDNRKDTLSAFGRHIELCMTALASHSTPTFKRVPWAPKKRRVMARWLRACGLHTWGDDRRGFRLDKKHNSADRKMTRYATESYGSFVG